MKFTKEQFQWQRRISCNIQRGYYRLWRDQFYPIRMIAMYNGVVPVIGKPRNRSLNKSYLKNQKNERQKRYNAVYL